MPADSQAPAGAEDYIEVDLRNPVVAAVWAWLVPGAGHIYQRRYAKGILFFVCILGTYFAGLTLGGGHVVYASWRKGDRRWQYICQLGVGAAALPAVVQSKFGKPLGPHFMAPPTTISQDPDIPDDLSELHLQYHSRFELGTLYTMIAGLLNVLAIYDAYAGPVVVSSKEETERGPPEERGDKS